MNRRKLFLLILCDFMAMAMSCFGLWARYHELKGEMATVSEDMPNTSPVPAVPDGGPQNSIEIPTHPPEISSIVPGTEEDNPVELTPATLPEKTQTLHRKTFYFDGPAPTVSLAGDFTQWKPVPFTKNDQGRWILTLEIPAGDHSYNLLVNGKTIRDPYQRRTDEKGRSLISVR